MFGNDHQNWYKLVILVNRGKRQQQRQAGDSVGGFGFATVRGGNDSVGGFGIATVRGGK